PRAVKNTAKSANTAQCPQRLQPMAILKTKSSGQISKNSKCFTKNTVKNSGSLPRSSTPKTKRRLLKQPRKTGSPSLSYLQKTTPGMITTKSTEKAVRSITQPATKSLGP